MGRVYTVPQNLASELLLEPPRLETVESAIDESIVVMTQ